VFRKQEYLLALIIALAILIFSGCSSNYYITAYNLQQRGNYIGAIENYDEYIARSKDGALLTRALNNRSESYYRLGMQAMNRENYRLAIRFFYLANSDKADEKMIDCYLTLVGKTTSQADVEATIGLYDFIIETFADIPALNEVIYRRLVMLHQFNMEPQTIFDNYVLLVERDKEEIFTEDAKEIIDDYLPEFIEEAKSISDDREAIERLEQLLSYPHSYQEILKQEIGLKYLRLADHYRDKQQYQEAEKLYSLAEKYDPELKSEISERLNRTITEMIEQGNNLLRERKISEAIEIYRQTFSIIPDNPAAVTAITRAEEFRNDLRQAKELFDQALRAENEGNYQEALRLYRQSFSKDRSAETSEKISYVTNMIQLDENPEFFAEKIITEYKNGLIVKNLNKIADDLREKHQDEINVSGWRIMLSTGEHRYEIRYDITSRTESYYYIWQVNLLTKQLTPLNTISTKIME
jgi:tetratricopeptide (TPR) repeat protein